MIGFEGHGDADLFWEHSILHVKFSAPFNQKGASEACNKIEKQYPEAPNPWARIDLYSNKDILAPTTAFDILQSHIQITKEFGCCGLCIVGANILVAEYFTEISGQHHLPFYSCDTYQQALNVIGKLVDSSPLISS